MSLIPVAGYCRVSTDSADQANSFASQQRYFREQIRNHPEWELYEIYADEGITGTSTRKRKEFNRMIRDAQDGKFRLILTKEVSRFSRNILDTISYTRQLREMGVGVLFFTDRINTLDPEAEMLLSFLASLAQEESRRTSVRVVWGQTRQMERGVVFGPSLLGYDVKDGILHINAEGAETVRLIFRKYALEQKSTAEIARFLTERGCTTSRGNRNWQPSSVVKILRNEKYAGDLVQRKSCTPDYLTHVKRRNTGQLPMICLENHHEPIISRELWNLAQQRLRQNNRHGDCQRGHSNRYTFSGMIRCGECGSNFQGRFRYRKDGTKVRRWSCSRSARQGTCQVGKLLRDDDAMHMMKTALGSLWLDKAQLIRQVSGLVMETITEKSPEEYCCRLQAQIDRHQAKKEAVMDSYFSREITAKEMQTMKARYDESITALQEQLTNIRQEQSRTAMTDLEASVKAALSAILAGEMESQILYRTILDSITVYKDRHMELRLKELSQVFIFIG